MVLFSLHLSFSSGILEIAGRYEARAFFRQVFVEDVTLGLSSVVVVCLSHLSRLPVMCYRVLSVTFKLLFVTLAFNFHIILSPCLYLSPRI